jgi:hypothetical protein
MGISHMALWKLYVKKLKKYFYNLILKLISSAGNAQILWRINRIAYW